MAVTHQSILLVDETWPKEEKPLRSHRGLRRYGPSGKESIVVALGRRELVRELHSTVPAQEGCSMTEV